MLHIFLVLLVPVGGTSPTDKVYSTTAQEVVVPEGLGEPVYVSYKHRSVITNSVVRVETVGIRLSEIEELSSSSNVIKSYKVGELEGKCQDTAFIANTGRDTVLSTKSQPKTDRLQRRYSLPQPCNLFYNTTINNCEPIEFLDTKISREVTTYQVSSRWETQRLCFPDCQTSWLQTPVFNNSVQLSYNISNWYFCTASSCNSQKVGEYLRLTFELLYPDADAEDGLTMTSDSIEFQLKDRDGRCKTQYNRGKNNFGTGDYCSVVGESRDFNFLSDKEANNLCHNHTYLGWHGLGDDFKQFSLWNKGDDVKLRFSEHVIGVSGVRSLQGDGMQGPTYSNGKMKVVLPRDSAMQYNIMVEMNKSSTWSLSNLLLLLSLLTASL